MLRTVDQIVVRLGRIAVVLQRQTIAVGQFSLGRVIVRNGIFLGRISDRIGRVRVQAAREVGLRTHKVCGGILAPRRQRIGLKVGSSQRSADVRSGCARGKRQLLACFVGKLNDIALHRLEHELDIHVVHAHVALHALLGNGQLVFQRALRNADALAECCNEGVESCTVHGGHARGNGGIVQHRPCRFGGNGLKCSQNAVGNGLVGIPRSDQRGVAHNGGDQVQSAIQLICLDQAQSIVKLAHGIESLLAMLDQELCLGCSGIILPHQAHDVELAVCRDLILQGVDRVAGVYVRELQGCRIAVRIGLAVCQFDQCRHCLGDHAVVRIHAIRGFEVLQAALDVLAGVEQCPLRIGRNRSFQGILHADGKCLPAVCIGTLAIRAERDGLDGAFAVPDLHEGDFPQIVLCVFVGFNRNGLAVRIDGNEIVPIGRSRIGQLIGLQQARQQEIFLRLRQCRIILGNELGIVLRRAAGRADMVCQTAEIAAYENKGKCNSQTTFKRVHTCFHCDPPVCWCALRIYFILGKRAHCPYRQKVTISYHTRRKYASEFQKISRHFRLNFHFFGMSPLRSNRPKKDDTVRRGAPYLLW